MDFTEGGVGTKIRILQNFSKKAANPPDITPAALEITVEKTDVLAVDEILTFASLHGNFVCISDRILHQFQIIIDRQTRLEILKDALLQVAYLERDESGSSAIVPYAIEDLVEALERLQQSILEGRETAAIEKEIAALLVRED
ncbi:MAG: hypothetical protein KO206_00975 [Methanomicrobiaceae archaeon]|uniref:Uncharacterized protein n=1 Tax=hydrocarbon metagenome TaxID=938273 RepID=A0A0W8FIA6_9ZZZZ|nr:hypothetical protein [Methanomicrobiaceae archaeon]MDD5418890.1 hypothetical protein [Methanomicrobiaceae archaeon]